MPGPLDPFRAIAERSGESPARMQAKLGEMIEEIERHREDGYRRLVLRSDADDKPDVIITYPF